MIWPTTTISKLSSLGFFLPLTEQLDDFGGLSSNSAGAQHHHDAVIIVVGLNHKGVHISVKPWETKKIKTCWVSTKFKLSGFRQSFPNEDAYCGSSTWTSQARRSRQRRTSSACRRHPCKSVKTRGVVTHQSYNLPSRVRWCKMGLTWGSCWSWSRWLQTLPSPGRLWRWWGVHWSAASGEGMWTPWPHCTTYPWTATTARRVSGRNVLF